MRMCKETPSALSRLAASSLPVASASWRLSIFPICTPPLRASNGFSSQGADLEQLGHLIHQRQPEDAVHLLTLHRRYLAARVPQKGETASLAYRLRILFLDRRNPWRKLTRDRTWH